MRNSADVPVAADGANAVTYYRVPGCEAGGGTGLCAEGYTAVVEAVYIALHTCKIQTGVHFSGGYGAVECIVQGKYPVAVTGISATAPVGIGGGYQSVLLVIYHIHFSCTGYFFYDHAVALVVFIAEALFIEQGAIEAPAVGIECFYTFGLYDASLVAQVVINIISAEPVCRMAYTGAIVGCIA